MLQVGPNLAVVTMCFLSFGCDQTATVRPEFEPGKYHTIAVLPFDGDAGQASIVADGIEERLLSCGIDIIDRSRLAALIQERQIEEIDFVELGKLLGADLLISGSVTGGNLGIVWGGSYRGVDTQDGRVQFSGQFGDGGIEATTAGRRAGTKICAALAHA